MKTERKIQLFGLIFLIIAMFATTSCAKFDYCAECYESSLKMDANYCGSEKEVDKFIETLKKTGSTYGQSWSCKKSRD